MRLRDWVITLSLLIAVTISILAMGGVLRWTQALVAFIVAIGIGITALSRRGFAHPSPLVALLVAASGLTAIQLLPTGPLGEHLAASTTALRADGAQLLDTSPWNGLTSDPAATLGSLVVLLALLGIALLALRIAASERGRYRIVAGVGALCGVTAIVAGVHTLFGLHSLYGIYTPQDAHPLVFGPLLNTNSLACLMAVGASLGIALAAHRRQPVWLRVIWLLLVPLCGAIVVATVSRGGTIALAVGALVTIGVLIAQRLAGHEKSKKRRTRFLSSALPIGVIAGCVTALVIWSNAGNVERQLSQLSMDEVHASRSKYAAWDASLQLIREQPMVGVGRGGFETSFTRVHEASGVATYPYLENEYLQAVVDWGIPGAILLGGIALWGMAVALRRWRDNALAAGSLGALAVVAAQSNVDFGLEFLGLSAPVVALAACLLYVPLREPKRPKVMLGLRFAHVVALLGGGALLLSSVTKTVDEDRRDLSQNPTLARAREAATRHPLDYYPFAVAAQLGAANRDPNAIRLLNHAMTLHPTHPRLHLMAARMLYADEFKAQATIEYAAALRMTNDIRPVISEILSRFSPELAATALPASYPDLQTMVTTLGELGHRDVATLWLGHVLDVRPTSTQACEMLYSLAQAGDLGALDIAQRRCSDRLPDYETRVALAKLLAANHAQADVIKLLSDVESWQSRREDKVNAWLLLCDAHQALEHPDDAKRCLRRLDASPDMLDARRKEILQRIDAINHVVPSAHDGAP